MYKYIFIISLFLFVNDKTYSYPVGKGLSCFANSKERSFDHKIFRGLFFESEKSVRVVSFKNKNNSLKIISKQTHYKISDDQIKFKIKFIWYGSISFEDFILDRNTLMLEHVSKNNQNKLSCEILSGNFMHEMNQIKSSFQLNYDQELKKNKI